MAFRIKRKLFTEVKRPPKGWRKSIPLAIKLQVIVDQQGRAPDGTPLDAVGVGIAFDHRPPLHEREYDEANDDTVPAANDPRYLVALPVPEHQKISGRDVSRMKKTERQRAREQTFRDAVVRRACGDKRKAKGTIRSRPFPKRNGY